MDFYLPPDLEQLVSDKVQTGVYKTASEVIREGLILLKERDQRVEALRTDIRAGFDAFDRGEFVDYDENEIGDLAERVKARGRRSLVEGETKTEPR